MRTTAYELSLEVGVAITPEFLAAKGSAEFASYRSEAKDLLVDSEGLSKVVEYALTNFKVEDIDAWLAPRVHAVLRLDRRHASRAGFWRWLAIEHLPEYVRYRWAEKGSVKPFRYLGTGNFLRRNALSRLWWGAEVMRNGGDYRAVEPLMKDSALDQYILDSRFGHLRPSALAFARIASGKGLTKKLTFDQVKGLAKAVNLLLAGASLESLSPDGDGDHETGGREWFAEEPDVDEIIRTPLESLQGPPGGACEESEIADYERWFLEVAREMLAYTASKASTA